MNEIKFMFEELPLAQEGNVALGLTDGHAFISYDRSNEEWWVTEVVLDGYENGKCRSVAITAGTPLHSRIVNVLESGRWADRVLQEILDDIEGRREAAAEHRAEMRREEQWS